MDLLLAKAWASGVTAVGGSRASLDRRSGDVWVSERMSNRIRNHETIQTVYDYLDGAEQWQEELRRLREILVSTELEEAVKWGAPCYTHNGKIVVGIGGFKSYVGLWFWQGALLADPHNVLINAQEGRTKAMRQWRFSSLKEIRVRKIKAYVSEAISLQEKGLEIKADRNKPLKIPDELKNALSANGTVSECFLKFTRGKQREFADYISDAKRLETKLRRLEKIIPMIKSGVGLNDKYR